MEISESGKNLLEEYEGKRLQLYNDSVGKPTIGIGHCLTAQERASGIIKIGDEHVCADEGLTEDECDKLFHQDLAPFVEAVNKITAPLTQNNFDALVCLAFNIGVSAFLGSGVFRCINARDNEEAIDHWRQWNKAGGHIIPGLTNRRIKEIALFKTVDA